MNSVFVSFGTEEFASAQRQIVADAKNVGCFDKIDAWTTKDVTSSREYKTLPSSIKGGRGFGCFWWKPYLIRRSLQGMPDGAIAFYSDVGWYGGGFRLSNSVQQLMARHAKQGFCGVEVPQFGRNVNWTAEDCFVAMKCTENRFREAAPIQATFSMWVNSHESMRLLNEWEMYCRCPEAVCGTTDICPNSHDFRSHRHDQSIMSNLAAKHAAPRINITRDYEKPVLQFIASRSGSKIVNKFKPLSYEVHVAYKMTDFVNSCEKGSCKWLLFARLRIQRFRSQLLRPRPRDL